MSFMSVFNRVQITGLGTGWTRNVDIGTFQAIPANTKYAVFEFESTSTGSGWGIDNYEAASTEVSTSPATVTRGDQFKYIPLGASENIDFYLSNTSAGKWWLIGYTDHLTESTPVDKYASVTGTGTYTIDCSADLPSGATGGYALVKLGKLAKIGAVGETSAQYKSIASNYERIHVIVPLGSGANDRKFEISGSAAMTAGQLIVCGWAPAAAYQRTTDPSTNRYLLTQSAWTELAHTSTTVLDDWRISNATTTSNSPSSQIAEMRPSGDTSFSTTDATSDCGFRLVKPNGSGKVQTYVTAAGMYATWYGGWVADTAAPAILDIDTLVEGAIATITLDTSVASFTSLAIKGTDDHIITVSSFGGSGDTWTFTVPPIADDTESVRIGSVSITPTTSGGVGEEYATTYTKTDYTSVTLEDVLTGNLGEVVSADPVFKTATQVAYDSTKGAIDVHGIYAGSYTGTQDIYYYDPDDFTWRLITLTTEDGVPSTGGGLTSSGLTSSGLTSAGLTSSGL